MYGFKLKHAPIFPRKVSNSLFCHKDSKNHIRFGDLVIGQNILKFDFDFI